MKSKLLAIIFFLMTTSFLSFIAKYQIDQCYITFNSATGLLMDGSERIPKNSENTRKLKTENGEVEVTRIDGYQVLYYNEKSVPFVTLKGELSKKNAYDGDQKKVLDNLTYLNAQSPGMETKGLMELEFNGYKIYGLSRGTIESGNTLGSFVMFPGEGVTIYFNFNNAKPTDRSFQTVDDYKKQRNRFLEEYTNYLKGSLNK